MTYPSEKYESQLEWLFPIYGKIKNVPNHQPEYQRFAFLFISSYINLKHQNCKELIQRKKQCWKPWCSKSNIGAPAAPAYVPFNLGKLSSYDYWLVKNISSSVGIIIPNIGKIIKHVPNHQPVLIRPMSIFRLILSSKSVLKILEADPTVDISTKTPMTCESPRFHVIKHIEMYWATFCWPFCCCLDTV